MLQLLQQALFELPGLIDDPTTPWKSLAVRYETPHVDRVWLQWRPETRLFLHEIYSCDRPLLHPHPWPSAVVILQHYYEMEIGYGDPGGQPPPVAATVTLGPKSDYEMVNPWAWHSVRPLHAPVLSVMVTGMPWPDTGVKHPGAGLKHEPLSTNTLAALLKSIRALV